MIVETKMLGRRTPFERLSLTLPDGEYTLAGLLTQLVRQEVAGYRERQDRVGLLRVMSAAELQDGAAAGRVAASAQARAGAVDEAEAVQAALRAFGDGLYYVFVDDVQVRELDAALHLRPDSTLLLLRLTALAGG